MKPFYVGLGLVLQASGCVDTGTQVHTIELSVQGSGEPNFTGRDEWNVELTRARVAFGPVVFCPGRSAGEFCDTARAEWLDAAVVDGLDARQRRAGEVVGASGPVSSWMFDYGLVSLLTESKPYVTKAARTLDGNSVDVAGCASKGERSVCFELRAKVSQTTDTEQGVPVVRVNGAADALDFGAVDTVTFRFDPAQWLAQVDFDEMTTAAACEGECQPHVLAPDSQAVRAVQTALVASGKPSARFVGEE